LDDVTSWEGFHALWPAVLVQQLNRVLPPEYAAEPRVHLGAQVEVDVATFENDTGGSFSNVSASDEVTATAWAPAPPTLTIEPLLVDQDEYEVRIYDQKRGRRLVAAIEIVSPANKDRSEHRHGFVSKCIALLQQEITVCIVDLVTVRHFNLYLEMLDWLGHTDPMFAPAPPDIYATACRWGTTNQRTVLDAWSYPLHLGEPLPTLPLWLSSTFVIPLDLETSYLQACRDLRIT